MVDDDFDVLPGLSHTGVSTVFQLICFKGFGPQRGNIMCPLSDSLL